MLDNYMRVPQTGDPTAYVGLAAAGRVSGLPCPARQACPLGCTQPAPCE